MSIMTRGPARSWHAQVNSPADRTQWARSGARFADAPKRAPKRALERAPRRTLPPNKDHQWLPIDVHNAPTNPGPVADHPRSVTFNSSARPDSIPSS
jgi:hypothetical protein